MTVTKLDLTKKRPVKAVKIFTHEIGTIEFNMGRLYVDT